MADDPKTPDAGADASPPADEQAAATPARKPRARRAATPKAAATPAAAEQPVAETDAPAPAPRKPRARRAATVADAQQPAEPAPAASKPRATRGARKPAAETAAPATARRSSRRTPPSAVPARPVTARARYVRSSARKARLVCDHIRGKSVVEARAILAFAPRAVARDWSKLLESAVANAEHNHELVGDELRIAAAFADEGPTLKRVRPRAMGRATPIHKRTSHLTITLTAKE